MIPSKRRSNLIMIQRHGEVPGTEDDRYGPETGWFEDRQAWVSINPDRGREVFKDNEREAIVTYSIRGDYLDLHDVEATMRIVFRKDFDYSAAALLEADVFSIHAVMPNEDVNDDVMLKCTREERKYAALTE